jgi:UDP-N-acetylmuramoyl-L-alanyl-D-glutamate--2,6-diaminopimelate ligase
VQREAKPVKPVPVATLLANVPDAAISGPADTLVQSITFDSRLVTPGSLFVALRGGYADGHNYLEAARAGGAVAVLVEPETPEEHTSHFSSVIRVKNTRRVLATISATFFENPSRDLTVIGVTGTDGKTSTCWYVRQMLDTLGVPSGLISTVAIQIPGKPDRSSRRQTTPESLDVQQTLREIADAGGKVAILETTSHALETYRVDACKFDIGVVTNVTREHLDFHGSIQNYRNAKAGLLRRVNASRIDGGLGVAVLNADDEGAREIACAAGDAQVVWYSKIQGDARVRAENVTSSATSSAFNLTVDDARLPIVFPLPGSWNVSNILAATGALHALGIETNEIAAAIQQVGPVPGRLVSVDEGQPFTVLVDYAHTPESLRAVLQEVRNLTTSRILVAFGSAGERDLEKRGLQGAIAAELADYSVFTSEDPRFEDPEAIIEAIATGAEQRGVRRGVDFLCIEDRREAISHLVSKAQDGDIVVLAGKGHEKSMIYGSEQRPWNEEKVARDALRAIGFGHMENEGSRD